MITDFLNRWVYQDFIVPVWPNLAASPIVAGYVAVSHILRERAARARHAEVLAAQHRPGCTGESEAR